MSGDSADRIGPHDLGGLSAGPVECADHDPAYWQVRVHDSTAQVRYLVLPLRPHGTDGWTEERLAEPITRDSMIGAMTAHTP